MESTLVMYADGLCEPNPGGTGTWGFGALQGAEEIHSACGVFGHGEGMTGNICEYTAVIEALLWAEHAGHRGFTVRTDSQLVVKQSNMEWACNARHLEALRNRVRKGLAMCQATIAWVPREQNQRADALTRKAYAAATGQSLDEPAVYVAALRALDGMDAEVQDGFEVDFLASNLERVQQYGARTRFSAKQQAVIRKMAEQYLGAAQAAEWFHGQQRLL